VEAAKHDSNPQTMHFDTRGNALEIVELAEGRMRTARSDLDVFGNLTAKFDFLNRRVERKEFDMLGRPFI